MGSHIDWRNMAAGFIGLRLSKGPYLLVSSPSSVVGLLKLHDSVANSEEDFRG